MDNNLLSNLLNMFTGGQSQADPNNQEQNPAYYGYPKEAYNFPSSPSQPSSGLNLEGLLTLLAKNKGGLSSLTNLLASKNPSLANIASAISPKNKKEESSSLPDKEILL